MKVSILILICTFFSFSLSAQFFSKSPHFKPRTVTVQQQRDLMASSIFSNRGTLLDTTYWALRPIVTAATAYPSGKIMAGGGLSYQNLTYTYPVPATPTTPAKEGSTNCNYSLSLLTLFGGTLDKDNKVDVPSEAFMVGFLNNHAGVGVSHTRAKADPLNPLNYAKKSKWELLVSYNINFNN